jgi:23S rRNA (guanosine2251-2'-O)-methyltransferase
VRQIILIIHNVRSAHNAGSLLRTADGLGIERVIFSGYTPYPQSENDSRLPHLAQKTGRQIQKTALGAEKTVPWQRTGDIKTELVGLLGLGYQTAALEQTPTAIPLAEFKPPPKIALIVGNEISGLEPEVLSSVAVHLQIPMLGTKESFNVAAAAAMALYHLRFMA